MSAGRNDPAWQRFHERSQKLVRCCQCGTMPAKTFPIRNSEHVVAFCSETCALAWALANVRDMAHWCAPNKCWRAGALDCNDCRPAPVEPAED